MRSKLLRTRAYLFTLLLMPCLAGADTFYIRDVLYAPLRSGPANDYRVIHAGIISGTKVTRLEISDQYSKVALENGKTGWLRTEYLTNKKIAKDLLQEAEQKIILLSQGNKPLLDKLTDLELSEQKLTNKLSRIETEYKAASEELKKLQAVASEPAKIAAQNEQLLKDKEQLSNQLDLLKAENSELKNSSNTEAMLNTLMAIVFGVVLTLLIPVLKPRKRSGDEW